MTGDGMEISEKITVRNVSAPGPHGSVPIRHYAPKTLARVNIGLVWVHGGSFTGGDLEMPESHWVASQLAERGITVFSVDYRLAKEGTRYPIPSDDVLAGWNWALSVCDEFGIDPSHLSIGGASAGANLACGVVIRLRDATQLTPQSVILAYPVVHARLPSYSKELVAKTESLAKEIRFLPNDVRTMSMNYVGNEALFSHAHAFPGNANFLGLPPFLIINSEMDDLRSSGEALAAGLALAGNDVSLVCEKGTYHGHLNRPELPEATRSLNRIARWLQLNDFGTRTG